jgi:hypothetical protein
MNRQNNQPEQNTNQPQQPEQQNGGFPGLSGFLFPLNFVFGERQRDQTSNSPQFSTAENNPQQQPQAQQQIPQFNFFIYPMPGTQEGDNATTPGIFFFTPFFMTQEVRKPHASESAMKRLPIVIITKEHVNSHASCPICLESFSLSIGQEENKVDDNKTITTETNKHEPVRQMPCDHMFCESCLFQWLRQNNSCPLCRKEIEAERIEAQPNVPNVPIPAPTTTANDANDANTSSPSSAHCPTISCALASVGCCEEIDNDTRTPIITLPQCHHRFHASCLRTSLLVEGYPPDDFNLISRPLNFRCPTCRAPAIVQSDVLKMPAVLHNERQQDRQGIPFNLPLTIHIPDSDDMDLD